MLLLTQRKDCTIERLPKHREFLSRDEMAWFENAPHTRVTIAASDPDDPDEKTVTIEHELKQVRLRVIGTIRDDVPVWRQLAPLAQLWNEYQEFGPSDGIVSSIVSRVTAHRVLRGDLLRVKGFNRDGKYHVMLNLRDGSMIHGVMNCANGGWKGQKWQGVEWYIEGIQRGLLPQ